MRMVGKVAAATAAVAMTVSAVPAWAGPGWHGHGRHHDRIDGGDVLLGALLAGGIIAIASAASTPRAAPADPYRDALPPPPAGPDGEDGGAPRYYDPYGTRGDGAAGSIGESAAVDRCASVAEAEGSHLARIARVGAIDSVDASEDGYRVRGTIELRDDWRSAPAYRGFSCAVGGDGPHVRFGD